MLGLSDLQFALAVIGVLILIAVAIFNIRHAYARKKAKEQGEYASDDRFGREPSFGQGFADAESTERSEPSFDSKAYEAANAPEKFAIDPRIDCVITLRFDEPISGSEILEEVSTWSDLGSQASARWMCEGLNADDGEAWEELNPEASYSELQLAIQLASRRGPIGVLELSDFCSRAQALAETLGSQIDMPSVSTMLESAKELDVMAADSDIQLSINILFDEPCPWGNFDALMRQRALSWHAVAGSMSITAMALCYSIVLIWIPTEVSRNLPSCLKFLWCRKMNVLLKECLERALRLPKQLMVV
jgi:hypothetical protein